MNRSPSMLRRIWRIATPYFSAEDKWPGRALLAAVIAIELAMVAINVLINQWNARFYNALQERAWGTFVHELTIFAGLAAAFVALAVYQLYLNQWLQIRWRKWMTARYLGDWLIDARHYRMQLQGDAADNPDQRIAEDLRRFAELGLDISLKLLNAIVTLVSFVVILWGLSAAAPLVLFGREWSFPGYLVWAALLYAVLGTLVAQLIGKPLVNLDYMMQKYEADFRFNLVRVRENGEQIALLRGEQAEHQRLIDRFSDVARNFMAVMSRRKKLTMFTAGYSQAAVVFPFIMASPAYFAGKIQLGPLMQTASAFGSVQESLSFIINVYRFWAEWQSVILRLDGFERAVATARQQDSVRETSGATIAPTADADAVSIAALRLRAPTGAPLIAMDDLMLSLGESVLVMGPSGIGKSTLLRAIAGIWPFASGNIVVPAGARMMLLPQRPYFPIGSLTEAIAYPGAASSILAGDLERLLVNVGLPQFAARLNEHGHWNRMLSGGEQQRLAIARALLHKPDILFLDEATASLDEAAEAALYAAIRHLLPDVTLISIGHRSTLMAFHDRVIALGNNQGTAFGTAPSPQEATSEAPAT